LEALNLANYLSDDLIDNYYEDDTKAKLLKFKSIFLEQIYFKIFFDVFEKTDIIISQQVVNNHKCLMKNSPDFIKNYLDSNKRNFIHAEWNAPTISHPIDRNSIVQAFNQRILKSILCKQLSTTFLYNFKKSLTQLVINTLEPDNFIIQYGIKKGTVKYFIKKLERKYYSNNNELFTIENLFLNILTEKITRFWQTIAQDEKSLNMISNASITSGIEEKCWLEDLELVSTSEGNSPKYVVINDDEDLQEEDLGKIPEVKDDYNDSASFANTTLINL
jgi:hypothetical protein